jgi:uncharacterized protein YkvS
MASCANVNSFGNLVEDFIEQYEAVLNDDTLSEVDSQDTETVLESLYAYRKAVKSGDLGYIKAQGFVKNQNDKNKEVAAETFKEVFGDSFGFTYGSSQKVRNGRLLDITPNESGLQIKFVEGSKTSSYSFSLSSDSRSRNSKSGNSHINIPGFRNFLDNYTLNLRDNTDAELVLGSQESNLKLDPEYRDKNYIHGSIDHMKNTLKQLHIMGGEKASQGELDGHLELLDKLDPSFFNDMELYIKDQMAESEGMYRARRIDVAINSQPAETGGQQSEASIYMEEVVHSMTASAIHANTLESRKLKRQLSTFLESARKQVTWQDFLPETSIDSAKEEQEAKALYRYIFSGKNSDYEFIAKGLTVPVVIKALKRVKIVEGKTKKRMLDYVNDFFDVVLSIIRGTFTLKQKNNNVHEALTNLAFSLGEINVKKNRDIKEKGGFLAKVFDLFQGVDDKAAFLLSLGKGKVLGDADSKSLGEVPEDLYGRVKYVASAIGLSIVNPSYRKAMGSIAGAYGIKANGTLRELIGGLFESDEIQKVAEFLGMQSGYIDKLRNNQIDLESSNTLSEFDPDTNVTKIQEEALTEVIADTDLASLFGKNSVAKNGDISKTVYDNQTLRSLLTDSKTLDRLIKNTKRALKDLDSTHYNWHSNQATGLGIYMATHQGTPEQNLNAENIARGIHSSHRKKAKAGVVEAIDELATLVAIKNTNDNVKITAAELMKSDWKGVQHVADVVEGFKKNSEEAVFKGRNTNKIKGYTREVFDDTIVMEIAPAENREQMEAKGFTFKSTLGPRAGDKRNKLMALYITDTASRPDRLRGATRLNQVTSKGTTITDISYKDGEGFNTKTIRERAKRDIQNIEREAIKRAKLMEIGEYDFTDTIFGVVPIINDNGEVVDYRYMMDKKTKKELLKQDTRISEVMGRSFGTILDKEKSREHNTEVLGLIKKDMNENWDSGSKAKDGLTDYSLIGPKSADVELRNLYYMLPNEFQDYINNREDKTLAVRTDLLFLYFGYSNLSISNFPGLKKITPNILIKVINFAEMMWMEMVKIVKGNILLKTPTVLLGNIFANIVYAVMRGYDPITVMKMYIESYRDITDYNNNVKRVQELTNKERSLSISLSRDILSVSRKTSVGKELTRVRGELEASKRKIADSPIDELVKLGMDQNVEDTTNESDRDSNRITSFIDDKLQVAPELVRDGLDLMFLTRRTTFYKIANEFLETSDLIARDVQNRIEKESEVKQADGQRMLPDWWLATKEEGYKPKQRLRNEERKLFFAEAKKQRQYDLVEDFINYTKPSSKLEEYLNKVGILMFTKYVKRIQRIILKTGSRAPIKAFMGAFGLAYLGGLPSIHEQSFFAKDWYGDSLGPGNVFPIYGPTDHFMNFITPALLKSSTADFSL